MSQGTPATAGKWPEAGIEAWNSLPHRPQKEPILPMAGSQTSGVQKSETINFSHPKPPLCLYFVTAASGNGYKYQIGMAYEQLN